MNYTGSLIKALDLTLVLNITILVSRFLYAFYKGARLRLDPFAVRLMLGIVVAWSGSWLLYADLTYKFWHKDFDPNYSVSTPSVRVTYLILSLLGSTLLVCSTFDQSFWRLTGLWVVCLVALNAALVAFDLGMYWTQGVGD